MILAIGSCFTVTISLWAFRDLSTARFVVDDPSQSASEDSHDPSLVHTQPAFSATDFDAVLWRKVQEPDIKAVPLPPPLPKLELLAITSIEGHPVAMIFDADSEQMISLKAGDSHGPTMILEVNYSSVRCIAYESTFTLTLGE